MVVFRRGDARVALRGSRKSAGDAGVAPAIRLHAKALSADVAAGGEILRGAERSDSMKSRPLDAV